MGTKKEDRLMRLKMLLINAPIEGMKMDDIMGIMGENYKTINYDLNQNEGFISPEFGFWRYVPTDQDTRFARAVLKKTEPENNTPYRKIEVNENN